MTKEPNSTAENSSSRRERRSNEKAAKKHERKLVELLRQFYMFLERKQKPSNEEVRSKFISLEAQWKMYCAANGLGIKTSLLFNARVSYEWERRYVKSRTIQN